MCRKADPNSFANLDQVYTKHIHLNLKVDFDNKILIGCAELTLLPLIDNLETVVIDTSNLIIKDVTSNLNSDESLPVSSKIFKES